MPASPRPVVLLHPAPQRRDRIFTPASLRRLHEQFEVIDFGDGTESHLSFAEWLPKAFAVIGQPDLPAELLRTATSLRAIVNVEGNFFPNVDYPTAFENGVRVLGAGPAYAQAVAEFSLGLALDLARGITREDRAMRAGVEGYVSANADDSILLRHSSVGMIGFGNLGRALRALLAPFQPQIRVFDPWLPEAVLREADVTPATLDETLTESSFVFVLATITTESEHLLDANRLRQLRDCARLILVSRAAVADFSSLLREVRSGRIRAAIDVWPEEPLEKDSEFRTEEHVLLSPHRAGGIPEAFHLIGEMVCDDLELLARGLPPIRLQSAAPELVGRYRNRPAG